MNITDAGRRFGAAKIKANTSGWPKVTATMADRLKGRRFDDEKMDLTQALTEFHSRQYAPRHKTAA